MYRVLVPLEDANVSPPLARVLRETQQARVFESSRGQDQPAGEVQGTAVAAATTMAATFRVVVVVGGGAEGGIIKIGCRLGIITKGGWVVEQGKMVGGGLGGREDGD